ncbi:hypothetical protein OAO87_00765 [bacterium]|nr:hypothetical protein [bacterium]
MLVISEGSFIFMLMLATAPICAPTLCSIGGAVAAVAVAGPGCPW